MPCVAAANTDLEGLMGASTDGKRLAEETIELCISTQNKGRSVLDFAQETQSSLRGLTSVKPAKFMTIMKLLDDDKRKELLGMVTGMDDLAIECSSKATAMQGAMQRGINSLPDVVKENNGEEVDTDHEAEEDVSDYFESDITDLEECTASLRTMNLLTATTKGTRAFESLVNKSGVCQTVFEKIKELCASVARLSQNFMMDGCCAQIQAGISSLKEMMRCLRLTNIIQALADAGRRMIEAFIDLIKVAWEKFGNFVEEFEAAKKLKTWVDGLNPLKSPGGKFVKEAAGLVSSLNSKDTTSIMSTVTGWLG
jgi:hypothetical protein